MLTSDYITSLSNHAIMDLYERYTQSIINDIARRLNKGAFASAAWQVQRLSESGLVYENALKEISQLTGKSEKELKKIFKDAGVKTMRFDDSIYKKAGLDPLPLNMSPAMVEVLVAGLAKTNGVMKNLTRTTASTSQAAFIRMGDIAHTQVVTGTMGYDQAIRNAIKTISQQGLTTVDFRSGHIDQLDVAMRRAVLTGVAQTTGKVQEKRANEMGVDLVQVSMHGGARPSHAEWQGKIYSRSGSDNKYPDFVSSTGYGTVEGLMGANCRHSWYPFFKGISKDAYDKATANQMENQKVTYNGKQMSLYDATQKQRSFERKIRAVKREARALDHIGFDNTTEILKIREMQATLRDFVQQTGLNRQYVREGGLAKISKATVVKSQQVMSSQPRITMDHNAPKHTGAFPAKRVQIAGEGPGLLKSDLTEQGWGMNNDIHEGFARHEVAAYDLDQLLGLDIVPKTTAYISHDGSFNSLQRWVSNATSDRDVQGGWNLPDRFGDLADRTEPGKMTLLDMLTANTDRSTGGSWVMSPGGHLKAIDNGLGFMADAKATGGSFFDFMHKDGTIMFKGFKQSMQLDDKGLPHFLISEDIHNKLKKLVSSGELRELLSDPIYRLNDEMIDGVLARAELVLNNWDKYFSDIPSIKDVTAESVLHTLDIPASTKLEMDIAGIFKELETFRPDLGSPEYTTSPEILKKVKLLGKPGSEPSMEAIRVIENIHGDGPLPTVELQMKNNFGKSGTSTQGDYGAGFIPKIRILKQEAAEQIETTLHEFGHFIDNRGLPSGNARGYVSEKSITLMKKWDDAVMNSAPIQKLLNIQLGNIKTYINKAGQTVKCDKKYAAYLTSKHEIWARSYAQYIATKANLGEVLTRQYKRSAKVVYPQHWSPEEFQPIFEAIDDLFKELGWLK